MKLIRSIIASAFIGAYSLTFPLESPKAKDIFNASLSKDINVEYARDFDDTIYVYKLKNENKSVKMDVDVAISGVLLSKYKQEFRQGTKLKKVLDLLDEKDLEYKFLDDKFNVVVIKRKTEEKIEDADYSMKPIDLDEVELKSTSKKPETLVPEKQSRITINVIDSIGKDMNNFVMKTGKSYNLDAMIGFELDKNDLYCKCVDSYNYLKPINNAEITSLGNVDFNNVKLDNLLRAKYSSNPVTHVKANDVIGIRTKEWNYFKIKVKDIKNCSLKVKIEYFKKGF